MSDKKAKICWELLKEGAIRIDDKELLMLISKIESAVGKYVR